MATTQVVLYHTVTGMRIASLDRFYTVKYSKTHRSPTEFTVNTTLADTNIALRDLVALRISAVVLEDDAPLLAGVLKPYGVSQSSDGDFDLQLTFSSPEVIFEKRLVLPYPYLPLLDQWGAPVVPSRGYSVQGIQPMEAIKRLYEKAMSVPGGGFPSVLTGESGSGSTARTWDPVKAFVVQEEVDSIADEFDLFYTWTPSYNALAGRVTWNLGKGSRTQTELPVLSGNGPIPSIIDLTFDQDASDLYGAVFFQGGQVRDELALGMFTQNLDPLTPLQELWDNSNGEEMNSSALQRMAQEAATTKPQVTWTGTLVEDLSARDIRIGDKVILDLSRTSAFPGYVSAPLRCVAIEGEVGVQATKITLKGDYDV